MNYVLKLFLSLKSNGGAMRDRTADLLRAKQALSQLSYSPFTCPFYFMPRCTCHLLSYDPSRVTPSFVLAYALPKAKLTAQSLIT